jgi:hypothetical protein
VKLKLFLLVLTLSVLTTGHSYAVTSAGGISITPSIQHVTVKPGQNTASYKIELTNYLPFSASITSDIVDFKALNQNGGVDFLSNPDQSQNYVHGLKNNISLSDPQFILAPKQTKDVVVTLSSLSSLAAGGHYASIIFKIQSLNNASGNHVSINQGIASLVFLDTFGQGTQILNITNNPVEGFYTHFPSQLHILIQNNGDTQSVPVGVVQIYDFRHHLVEQGQLNINSGLVLPQSNTLFTVLLHTTANRMWPGKYTLKILYSYANQSGTTLYQAKFVYVNQLILNLFYALIFLIAVYFIVIRRFVLRPKSKKYKTKK